MEDENQTGANVVEAASNDSSNVTTQVDVDNTYITTPESEEQVNTGQSTAVVAEPDHAADIVEATSHDDASNTYNYTSQGAKNYDESVTTSTSQAGNNSTMTATWDSEYKMSSDYTVDDSQDYTWNKLATEMANLGYKQEEAQARAQSIEAKQQLDQAATSAWNNYFSTRYSANQTQEKMGWSGGQQTASDLQVAFLQAETSANMYTQDEAQRYGVQTKLSIARMYAEANQKALALQYYQDAVDQALAEADITGYYIEPEAAEMMDQIELANEILEDPNSTQEEKDRATSVKNNSEAYFRSLNFVEGTRTDENGKTVTVWKGVETLALLSHKETERANRASERLQEQANKIAESAKGAAWAGVNATKAASTITMAREITEKGTAVDKNGNASSKTTGYYKYNGQIFKISYNSKGTKATIKEIK